jgi:uncharacterized protein with NAD-binding domain and iron-sulfur cluster
MNPKRKSVAVLGGGVAGLSAAHELIKLGYRVTVFESRGFAAKDLGGKARSFRKTHDGKETFGEHGFRFFPGFYQNLPATMSEIKRDNGGTVADLLKPVENSVFYARLERRDGSRPRFTSAVGQIVRIGTVLVLGWLFAAGLLWYRGYGITAWALWALAPLVWIAFRAVLVALTATSDSMLPLQLPGFSRKGKNKLQSALLRIHPWARFVLVAVAVAVCALSGKPVRAIPLTCIAIAVVWWYPLMATVSYLWRILAKIPLGVRPGILESAAASLKIAAVVSSSRKRQFSQWEQESWWSYIAAYRYSRPFRLAFATGLTRGFVATRAEKMSARTGATILTQLLYDIAPTLLSRPEPADRVLESPTQEAWIKPWIAQLRKRGVRFNTPVDGRKRVRRVEVTRLVVAADRGKHGEPRIAGFEFFDKRPSKPEIVSVDGFDHYVLAVAGTAAQRILANSPDVVRADRNVPLDLRPPDALGDGRKRTVPYLDGIFDLDFGWMTGIVFHLPEEVIVPKGHLLCLESEWALTAIEQRQFWCPKPGDWGSIVSVNVSDWFNASSTALPARFETLDSVADEVWKQLCDHIPEFREHGGERPYYVADTAITDPAAPVLSVVTARLPTLIGETARTAALENLSLTNDDKLLINTIGSWDKRPTARTVFSNLTLAGDYVRTSTDFASMEAANEAAKRAVQAICKIDEVPPEDMKRAKVGEPKELPVPPEVKWPLKFVTAIDAVAINIGFPHPLMLIATPLGWLARGEERLQKIVLWFRKARGKHPTHQR